MKSIHISDDLSFPADEALVTVFSVLAKRKSGKTGVLKRMAEEFYRLGMPFLIIDPIGIHWGLRMDFAGKKPSESKWAILRVVINSHPDPVPREDLAAALGKAYSGSFRNYLGRLRSMGLLDYVRGGAVATKFLMKEG